VSWQNGDGGFCSTRSLPAGVGSSDGARLGAGRGRQRKVQERVANVLRLARAAGRRILPQDPQEPGEVHVHPKQLGRIAIELQTGPPLHSEHEIHSELGKLREQQQERAVGTEWIGVLAPGAVTYRILAHRIEILAGQLTILDRAVLLSAFVAAAIALGERLGKAAGAVLP
jgi:hypothetical protein